MTQGMVFKSSEASGGAYQGVRKVRGLQTKIEQIPGKVSEQYPDPKDQAMITLEDAVIRKMIEGETEPELTDSRFIAYIPYAKPGKKPHKNSLWTKGFVRSGEVLICQELGIPIPEKGDIKLPEGVDVDSYFKNKYVVLARKLVHLFTDTDTGEDVAYETWCYEKDDEAVEDMDSVVRGLLVGKTKSVALRDVMTNPRAKQHPKYRQAITDGTVLEMLGLEVVGGKYQVA